MTTQIDAVQNPETEVQQIASILFTLPLEKIIEIRDYTLFLQARYGQVATQRSLNLPISSVYLDIADAWSDEDMYDQATASFQHAQRRFGVEDEYTPTTR